MASRKDLTGYRGDDQYHDFAYAGASTPSDVWFAVRDQVDGTLRLSLKKSVVPSQFTVTATGGVVTIRVKVLDTDTAGISLSDLAAGLVEKCLWYDLQTTDSGDVTTRFWGAYILQGDLAE